MALSDCTIHDLPSDFHAVVVPSLCAATIADVKTWAVFSGYFIWNSSKVYLTTCNVENSRLNAIHVDGGPRDVKTQKCTAQNSIKDSWVAVVGSSMHVAVSGCTMSTNHQHGLSVGGHAQVVAEECMFDSNGGGGLSRKRQTVQ